MFNQIKRYFFYFYFLILLEINFAFAIDSCWDKFDPLLQNQCNKGWLKFKKKDFYFFFNWFFFCLAEWLQRYYFDHASLQCRLFWWDGCRSEYSRNYFTDLLNCQWLCENSRQDEQNSKNQLKTSRLFISFFIFSLN